MLQVGTALPSTHLPLAPHTHIYTHSPQTPQTMQLFKKPFEEALEGFESTIASDPKLELLGLLFNDIARLRRHTCF